MKNMKKRIISLLLAIVFILGVQPTALGSSSTTEDLKDGVLTISGSGVMGKSYWGDARITKIVINEGITGIAGAIFQDCTNLTEVSLPLSLETIGLRAFEGCTALTTVNYAGTEAQKNGQLQIETNNDPLINAKWVYSKCSLSFTSAEVVQGETATVELHLDSACEGLGARLVVKADDGSGNTLPISAVNIGTSLSGAVNRNNDGTVVISCSGALAAGTVLASISFNADKIGSYELSVSGEMYTGANNSLMEFIVTPGTITVKKPTVNVTWKNADGSILKTEEVERGSTPSYSGSTPVKGSDISYTYSFAGWSPAVSAVNEDTVYTATFTPVERTYSVKLDCGIAGASVSIKDSDGNALTPNADGRFSLLATKSYHCVIEAVGYKSKEIDISISDSSLGWTFSGDSALLKIDSLKLAKGDTNNDGKVDMTDAQALYEYLAGNYDLDANGFAYASGKPNEIIFNLNVADINESGSVGADDILPMLEFVADQG